jgi:hypothetical protein
MPCGKSILQFYKTAVVIHSLSLFRLEKSDLVNWFNHSSHSGDLQIKPKEQPRGELEMREEKRKQTFKDD